MDVFSVMKNRRSARAYLDKPVSRAKIEDIFHYAGMAPSAINLQPWEYVIVYGTEKDRLVKRLKRVHTERKISCGPGTESPLPERFRNRSRRASEAMKPKVSELGLEFNQFIEDGSCSFYGAPVAIIVTIDRLFPKLRYLD
ncbi:MAG: nitroreductase family protein, partial [Desulfobacterales bacterium]